MPVLRAASADWTRTTRRCRQCRVELINAPPPLSRCLAAACYNTLMKIFLYAGAVSRKMLPSRVAGNNVRGTRRASPRACEARASLGLPSHRPAAFECHVRLRRAPPRVPLGVLRSPSHGHGLWGGSGSSGRGAEVGHPRRKCGCTPVTSVTGTARRQVPPPLLSRTRDFPRFRT